MTLLSARPRIVSAFLPSTFRRSHRSSDARCVRTKMASRWPVTQAVDVGILTSIDNLAVAPMTAAACFLVVTAIEAVPEIEPTLAVTVPLPAADPAEKVTGLPGFGEKLPSAGETDHVGVTDIELP